MSRKPTYVERIYWRDNANPYPGRLVSTYVRTLSAADRAWQRYVQKCRARRDALEQAEWARYAAAFESLADAACESAGDGEVSP